MLNDERSKTTTTKKVWLMFMTTLGTRPAGPHSQAADQGEVVGETWDAQTGVEFLIITLLRLIIIIIF